jgi:hypothetical protein
VLLSRATPAHDDGATVELAVVDLATGAAVPLALDPLMSLRPATWHGRHRLVAPGGDARGPVVVHLAVAGTDPATVSVTATTRLDPTRVLPPTDAWATSATGLTALARSPQGRNVLVRCRAARCAYETMADRSGTIGHVHNPSRPVR